jgi:hypothetical protein
LITNDFAIDEINNLRRNSIKKVVVRYFESSADLCLLEPWLRELGFTCCYGTIILKIYR